MTHPSPEKISIATLANGIKVVYREIASVAFYTGVAIGVGTRDEDRQDAGLAHLTEHMIFKGTEKRKSWHILNRMETVGGELNAYTTKEETFVYATALPHDMERAIEILCDITLHSVFPEKELAKEIEVVEDEIDVYRDSPVELIFDDFEELLFGSHPLGRNILGNAARLRKYHSADLQRFHRTRYIPRNMVVFGVGPKRAERFIRLVEKHFSGTPLSTSEYHRQPSELPHSIRQKDLKRRTHQAHVIKGGLGFSLRDEKKDVLFLLNNILGGPGMNSLLNIRLREKAGLAYNVESSVQAYSDTGLWTLYYGCDKEDMPRCEAIVHDVLDSLCQTPLKAYALRQYQKQLTGQLTLASDNFENMALGLGKNFLYFDEWHSRSEVEARICSISAETLREVAQEVIAPGRLTTLRYV